MTIRSSIQLLSLAFAITPALAQPAPTAPAPVSMVVFSDFECPFSAETFFTLESLQKKFPDRLHITWKQSPLSIHPNSMLAHRAALAAGRQGKFNAMAELLYANQNQQDLDSLLSFARQLHLDMVRFRRDLDSPAVAAELEADLEESRAFAVEQTPTLYVNGKSLIGVQSEQSLTSLITKTPLQIVPTPTSSAPAEPPLDPALAAELLASPTVSQGSGNAPLTIVEFTDFQCPFCRAAVEPMEQFMASRGRDVRWIVRSFPLEFHPDSELANEAALAAGEQGKYWQMHDLLFAHQSALKLENLRDYAQQLHLDMNVFNQALATHRFAGQIAADRALGTRAGVNGTPTFFIDGQPHMGAFQLPELNQIADAHSASKAPILAAAPVIDQPLPNQQILGPATDVPLTLTWYTDVRSPLAAQQAELVHKLAAKYDTHIRVLFRAFPLDSHPDGRISGAALLAALKLGKFWEMFDTLAQRRDVLDRAKLISIATGLGCDADAFARTLDAAIPDVTLNVNEAARRGIQGAPVLFVNRQRVDGLQREQFYTAILDSELKDAPAVQASLNP
jgi:protein-disulfide isomerase